MIEDISKVLIGEDELNKITDRLADEITKDYKNKNLLLVGILKGSVVFMSDLMRKINIPLEIDFMCVSSYESGVKSNGKVKIIKDLDIDLEGYDVLIVEDILDSGKTLFNVCQILKTRHPKSIKICTLFDKPSRREVELYSDYSGIEVPNEFIVGYGLDYNQKYRNLPFIGVLKPELYNN